MSWLAGNWWRAVAMAALAALAWQTLRIEGFLLMPGFKADLRAARAATDAEAAAHSRTKETYRLAQQEAARLEGARLMRVQAQQQEITDHVRQDLSERLAAARARFDALADADGLRGPSRGTGADGAAEGLAVPGAPGAAGRAHEAACAAGLSLPERWHATEQAIQLDALIDWLSDQLRVPINDAPQPTPSSNP